MDLQVGHLPNHKFSPNDKLSTTTGHFVKDALEKARKAKERIDKALWKSKSDENRQSHELTSGPMQIEATAKVDSHRSLTSMVGADLTGDSDVEEVGTVEGEEVTEVEEDYSEIAEYSDFEEEESEEGESSEGIVLKRSDLEKKGVLNFTIIQDDDDEDVNSDTKKDKKLVVLRDSKISASSDTDSSMEKKLRAVNSDQGSNSSDEFSTDQLCPSSSSNVTEEKRPFTGNYRREGGDAPTSSDGSQTSAVTSGQILNEPKPSFPIVDPELMENQWLTKLYERFSRPAWDSSPYNPSCNRPAWDENLYNKDAKDRLRKHEASQMNGSGMTFPWCPGFMGAAFPPGMMVNAPFFDVNQFQKAYFQLASRSNMVRGGQTSPSNKGSNKVSNSDVNQLSSKNLEGELLSEEVNPAAKRSGVAAALCTKESINQSTTNVGDVVETSSTTTRKPPSLATARIQRRTGSLDNRDFSKRNSILASSVRSRTIPKQPDYSVSWKQVQINNSQGNRKKLRGNEKKVVEQAKQPEKPRILNPLPRVALLSKSSLKRSTNVLPTNQMLDDRGRPKPQWDATPFIPIGKKNAWDFSIPKNDYYRLKYFGLDW